MSKWIRLFIALPLISAVLLLTFSGVSHAGSTSQSLYKKATGKFERLKKDTKKRRLRSQWETVIAGFDKIAQKDPGSPYAGYALFSKAEAVYGMYRVSRTDADRRYALLSYQDFAEKYPSNEYAAEALNKAGEMQLDLGEKEEAARCYSTLAANYPKSIYAASAAEKLKSLPKLRTGKSGPDASDTDAVKGLYRVADIRHWSNPDFTRVVIELEGDFSFDSHLIKAPDRLYFDVKGAFINSPLKDRPIDINDGILKAVRTSQYNSDTVRVVLDLESVGAYKTLMLPDPPRLVVDIAGKDANNKNDKSRKICLAKPESQAAVQPDTKPDVTPAQASSQQDRKPLTLSQQMGLCVATIVIDPGHGGKDSGAVGKNGLMEKDVVLDIGLRLRDIVKKELGCNVYMTRATDEFINLDERPGIALKHYADLFISIHANASLNRSARGIETYLLNTTKDRNIMELAARENLTTMKKMSDTYMILKDLLLDNKREDSLRLAHAVQARLVGDLKKQDRDVVDKGVKQGPFLVLYGAETPSILTEVGFISNPDEEKLLKSASYRQEVAEAIYNGIKEYVGTTKAASYNASLK
jgi:N-acetylmuramoyl-L-alanine amidase